MSASVSLTQPGSSALDEETARAELYGLISELFYAPPRPELLAQLRVAATDAPTSGGFLEEPWRQLVGVARDMVPALLRWISAKTHPIPTCRLVKKAELAKYKP